jgi:hypothetical protein
MPRRFLAQVACMWLAWYMSGVAASPVLIQIYADQAAAMSECHCAHGPGATCPMHNTPKGRATCLIRGAAHQDGLALISLLTPVSPVQLLAIAPEPGSAPLVAAGPRGVITRPLAPDSPPPRV